MIGPFQVKVLRAKRQLKATFNGLLIAVKDVLIIYLPHGYNFSEVQTAYIVSFKKKIVISSFSTYKLPFFLGGIINPGLQDRKALVEKIQAELVLQTHDYPKQEQLQHAFQSRFVFLDMNEYNFAIEERHSTS